MAPPLASAPTTSPHVVGGEAVVIRNGEVHIERIGRELVVGIDGQNRRRTQVERQVTLNRGAGTDAVVGHDGERRAG